MGGWQCGWRRAPGDMPYTSTHPRTSPPHTHTHMHARALNAQMPLTVGEPGAAEALAKADEDFAMAGGWDADKRIANVLTGLGFRQEQVRVPARPPLIPSAHQKKSATEVLAIGTLEGR